MVGIIEDPPLTSRRETFQLFVHRDEFWNPRRLSGPCAENHQRLVAERANCASLSRDRVQFQDFVAHRRQMPIRTEEDPGLSFHCFRKTLDKAIHRIEKAKQAKLRCDRKGFEDLRRWSYRPPWHIVAALEENE